MAQQGTRSSRGTAGTTPEFGIERLSSNSLLLFSMESGPEAMALCEIPVLSQQPPAFLPALLLWAAVLVQSVPVSPGQLSTFRPLRNCLVMATASLGLNRSLPRTRFPPYSTTADTSCAGRGQEPCQPGNSFQAVVRSHCRHLMELWNGDKEPRR